MNHEVKQKWLEALRSDRYSQASYVLRSPEGGFCCLGVLCDVVDPDGWASSPSQSACGRPGIPHLGIYSFPTGVLLNRVGITPDDQEARSFLATLASRNDGGWSFREIPDMIEESQLL